MLKLKEGFFSIVIFFLLGVAITTLLIIARQVEFFDFLSNRAYYTSSTKTIQSEYILYDDMIKFSDNTFVSKELGSDSRGIYFSEKYEYKLPVTSGRFFSSNDFKKDNNYIVLGKNLKKFLYSKNNKICFKQNGVEYEVIGIIGMKEDSVLDSMIIYNLANIYEDTPIDTPVIFGNEIKSLEKNIKNHKKNNAIKIINNEDNNMLRIWSASNIYKSLVNAASLIVILVGIYTYNFRSRAYYKKFYIYKILGFNQKNSYINISFIDLIYLMIFYLIGILMALPFIKNSFLINLSFLNQILFVTLSIFGICFLFSLINFKKIYYKLNNAGDKKWK